MNWSRTAGDDGYRVLLGARTATDDRRLVRLLMKSSLRARLSRLGSVIAILLFMLVLSAAVWGAVYLLNSARLR
jgi:hypothetical protein